MSKQQNPKKESPKKKSDMPNVFFILVIALILVFGGVEIIRHGKKKKATKKAVPAKTTKPQPPKCKPETITVTKYRNCKSAVCSALDMSSKHDLSSFRNLCPKSKCDSQTRYNLCSKLRLNSKYFSNYDCQNEKYTYCDKGKCAPMSYGRHMEWLKRFLRKHCQKQYYP